MFGATSPVRTATINKEDGRMSSTLNNNEILNQYLTKSACYCLNEDSRHPHSNLFVGDHTLPLKSDADEQLLLQLSFQQTVIVRKLQIGIPNDDSCPHHVKLFANKLNLGFSDAAGGLFSFSEASFLLFHTFRSGTDTVFYVNPF
jgi:hypothetical protein